jgi:hypothetical protein
MGAWMGSRALKINSQIRDELFFSHPVPFIMAHGFTGLKFIRNGFLNGPMDVSEA